MFRSTHSLASLLLLASFAHAQGLVDPGFETSSLPGTGPDMFGIWGLDVGARVGPTAGITPIEGDSMAQFVRSTALCATEPFGTVGDFVQLVDMADAAALVASGNARVRLSAAFNRIAGDAETDTRFAVTATAYDGDPGSFLAACSGASQAYLAQDIADLVTDGDPATWERIDTELAVPPGTTFVAVWVRAVENIEDDPIGSEFDGHFVDDVRFEVIDASQTTCQADLDGDGELTIFDFLAFQNLFAMGCP